jgi:hypothetical protein
MKRLAILTGSLAFFAANVALASPTLTKSEYEIANEEMYHQPSTKQRLSASSAKQEAAEERFEGTAARSANPVASHTVAYPERLFNLNP